MSNTNQYRRPTEAELALARRDTNRFSYHPPITLPGGIVWERTAFKPEITFGPGSQFLGCDFGCNTTIGNRSELTYCTTPRSDLTLRIADNCTVDSSVFGDGFFSGRMCRFTESRFGQYSDFGPRNVFENCSFSSKTHIGFRPTFKGANPGAYETMLKVSREAAATADALLAAIQSQEVQA